MEKRFGKRRHERKPIPHLPVICWILMGIGLLTVIYLFIVEVLMRILGWLS